MKKILVPVDFSDYTEKVCYYAIYFAQHIKAEVLLFHAYMYPIASADMTDDVVDSSTLVTPEIMESIESAAKNGMRRLKDTIMKKNGEEKIDVTIKTKVVNGMPEFEILDACDSYEPNVIIMGSSGQGHKSEKIIGSVALKILEKANVPVLTVAEDAEYKKISNILYTTNFDEADIPALESLIDILDTFDIKIHCLHFEHDKKMLDNMLLDYMKDHFKKEFQSGVISFDIVEGKDIIDVVDEYVKDEDIDLIAMLHHKRKLLAKLFHPSMAKKVFYHTHLPLLTFHEKPEDDESD